MRFSVQNDKTFSNLKGRFVLTPTNPIYSGLVTGDNFIIKKDIQADSIKTSSLDLIGLCDKPVSRSSGFRINKEANVHDIIMPKVISDDWVHLMGPSNGSRFGASVAISGDTCIIGDRTFDGQGTFRGAVYIYTKLNGVWVQDNPTPDGPTFVGQNNGDFLGTSVAISGNTCIVGSNQFDGKGAVFIYTKINGVWVQDNPTQAGPTFVGQYDDDLFGESVAISGDTCIVCARFFDGQGIDRGAVYIYTKINGMWVQDNPTPAGPTFVGQYDNDWFGERVGISGDTCIVGASQFDGKGAVYIYTKLNGYWVQDNPTQAGPTFVGQNNGDFLGYPCAISGDTCIVGASGFDGQGDDRGAIYIYTKINGVWVQDNPTQAGPTFIGQNDNDYFGETVGISGDTCIVGVFGFDGQGTNRGAVYIYTKVNGSWVQNGPRLDGLNNNSLFGFLIAIDCNTCILGAPEYDNGDAYIVEGLLYKGDITATQ